MDEYLLLCTLATAIVRAVKSVGVRPVRKWLTRSNLNSAMLIRTLFGGAWNAARSLASILPQQGPALWVLPSGDFANCVGGGVRDRIYCSPCNAGSQTDFCDPA
jgi:hypothetical protein